MSTVIFKVITWRKFQTRRIFTDPALKLSDGSALTCWDIEAEPKPRPDYARLKLGWTEPRQKEIRRTKLA